MRGRVSTHDIILDGNIDVTKNINLETLNATENKTYNVPEGVDGWDEVIVNVPSDEITIESKSITENGTYNAPVGVAGYNPITVDVQPDLEDIKITENGTYTPTAGKDGFSEVEVEVEPNLQGLNVTENGTYYPTDEKDGFSYAIVNVPTDRAVVVSKTVTANGTYNVPEGVDGFDPVIVNVPQQTAVIESKTITENGTYTPAEGVDGFAPVVVNVPAVVPTVEELTMPINHNGTFNLTENKPYGVDYFDPVIVTVAVPEPDLISKLITENGVYIASDFDADGFSNVTVNVPSGATITFNEKNAKLIDASDGLLGWQAITTALTSGTSYVIAVKDSTWHPNNIYYALYTRETSSAGSSESITMTISDYTITLDFQAGWVRCDSKSLSANMNLYINIAPVVSDYADGLGA